MEYYSRTKDRNKRLTIKGDNVKDIYHNMHYVDTEEQVTFSMYFRKGNYFREETVSWAEVKARGEKLKKGTAVYNEGAAIKSGNELVTGWEPMAIPSDC